MLNRTERLNLLNQFYILKKLYPEESQSFEQNIKILKQGYVYDYDSVFEELWEELDENISKKVLDILSMYRELMNGYISLLDEEKSKILSEEIKFKGFDGNEESRYLGYAEFLINDLGLFKESEKADLNTHYPMLRRYEKMLNKLNSINRENRELTLSEIRNIVDYFN